MIEKRHIVLAVMVLALGTAVYINWRFAGEAVQANSDFSTSSAVLGETRYVNGSLVQSASSQETTSGTASTQSGETASTESDDYFIQAQLSRQEARDKAMAVLEETLSAASGADSKILQEAVEQAAEIAERTEQESKIESLLKAKGYEECLAFLSEGKANIIVRSDGLLANETITIKDIVKNQSAIPFENIIIVEVK